MCEVLADGSGESARFRHERKRFLMAKNSKTHKAMTAKAKSTIVLAVLLVITLVVSYIGIAA